MSLFQLEIVSFGFMPDGDLIVSWVFLSGSICVFSIVRFISASFTWSREGEISEIIELVFLQVEDVYPVDLQMKHVILSSVKNIRN